MHKILAIIGICISLTVSSQTYQLVPDSCTFCFYSTSTGSNSWYSNNYGIDPLTDTSMFGNTYMLLSGMDAPEQPFAVRQLGNKLYGVVQDSTNEVLIMDFDALPGDTINYLYSEGYTYNAIVMQKDSFLVNNGLYHHYMRLDGKEILINGSWVNYGWGIKWNERGLCWADIVGFDWEYGGVLYNIPMHEFLISIPYVNPSYCTTDPTYNIQNGNTCINCIPVSGTESFDALLLTNNRELVSIINLMGQEIEDKMNTVLIYIYSDGTKEKVFKVE